MASLPATLMAKCPSVSVMAPRVLPLTMTVAPGIPALFSSRTCPVRVNLPPPLLDGQVCRGCGVVGFAVGAQFRKCHKPQYQEE